MTGLTERITDFYAHYSEVDLRHLADIYDTDLVFEDPIHRIEGVDKLRCYFESGRRGLLSCRFEFIEVLELNDRVLMQWVMHYAHRKLMSGKSIQVRGCSVLTYNNDRTLVTTHRDYFDLGEMIYEQVPLLGGIVKWVKNKLSE